MPKITNKENLISQLDAVRKILSDEEKYEPKMIVESMFALQRMVNCELINRLCCPDVFDVLTN